PRTRGGRRERRRLGVGRVRHLRRRRRVRSRSAAGGASVTASPPAPAPAGRWSRWILFASLALNLFFVGAWAAFAWRHYAGERHGPWNPATRIERLAASLPSADGEK